MHCTPSLKRLLQKLQSTAKGYVHRRDGIRDGSIRERFFLINLNTTPALVPYLGATLSKRGVPEDVAGFGDESRDDSKGLRLLDISGVPTFV